MVTRQEVLSKRLDKCLVTDEEMERYTSLIEDPNALMEAFPNRIDIELTPTRV